MSAVNRNAWGRILFGRLQTLARLIVWLFVWLLGGGTIALLAGFMWLTTTPQGSRWAIDQATKAVTGLSIQSVQGTFFSQLELRQIQYHDATGLAVHLQTAFLHWDWRQLWRGRLQVNQLSLHTGQITLPATASAPAQARSAPMNFVDLPLSLPLAITVNALNVTDVTLIQAVAPDGAPFHPEAQLESPPSYHLIALRARGSLTGDSLNLQVQSAKADLPADSQAELSGSLTVGTPAPHRIEGVVQSVVALPQGWLSSEIHLGGSLAEISLALASRWDGFDAPSATLTAKARLTLARLTLDSLNLDTLGGTLCSQGTVKYADGLALSLHGRASALNPARLNSAAHGQLGFDYQLDYTQPQTTQTQGAAAEKSAPTPQMALKLSALSGKIAGTPFNHLNVEAHLAHQQLSGSISGGAVAGGTLQAQWHYGLTGNQPIKLSADVTAVSLDALLAQGAAEHAHGTLTAHLALAGALGAKMPEDSALKFSLIAPKASLGFAELPRPALQNNALTSQPISLPMTAHIAGSIANQKLTIDPSTLAIADTALRAEGQWGWQPDAPPAQIRVDLSAPELAHLPWAAFGLPPVAGAVQINTRLSGSVRAPRVTLDFSARHLAFERWHLAQFKAQGQLGSPLAATVPSQGAWPFKMAMQANDLMEESASGKPSSDKKIAPPQRWLNTLNLALNGTLPALNTLSAASGSAAIKTTQTLTLSAQSPHGKLTLAANGSGQGQDWRGVIARLDLSALSFKQHALGSWRLSKPVVLRASPRIQQLAEACLTGQGNTPAAPAQWCFAGVHAGDEMKGQLSLNSPLATVLDLAAPWLPKGLTDLPNLSKAVPGRMILSVNGGLQAGKPSGVLKLSLPDSQFSLPHLADGKVFTYQNLVLDAALVADAFKFDLAGDLPHLAHLESHGSIKLSRGYPLDILSKINLPDLSALAFLLPSVSQLKGKAQAAIQLGGVLAAPKPSGTLNISELAFALPDTGVGYDQGAINGEINAAGQLTFAGQLHGMVDEAPVKSARSADRQIHVHGTGDLAHLPQWQVNAQIQGNGVPVLRIPSMKIDASPDMALQATQAGASLSGTVQLPIVDARIEKLPEGVVKSSDDLVIVGAKPQPIAAGYPLTGDIKLSLGDTVNLTGMGFSTGLTGALDLRLRPQKPLAAFGEIDLKNGKYKAYGQDLSISQGRLLFVGPLDDPGLAVTAQRTIDSTTVGLNLGGTLYHPKTTVFSSPSIPESDALSLLLTGRRLNDGTAADSSVLLNAVASLGIARGDDILRDVGQKFGFDSIGLDTTGGLTGTRFSVGKKIGDRLLVRYAIGVLTGVGQIITEYQLNKYFSIEITSSPVATGGDVIYRIR